MVFFEKTSSLNNRSFYLIEILKFSLAQPTCLKLLRQSGINLCELQCYQKLKGNCHLSRRYREMRAFCLHIQEGNFPLRQEGLVLLRKVHLCGLLRITLRLQVHIAAFQPQCDFPNYLLYGKDNAL